MQLDTGDSVETYPEHCITVRASTMGYPDQAVDVQTNGTNYWVAIAGSGTVQLTRMDDL
jgi:hypothetical protein